MSCKFNRMLFFFWEELACQMSSSSTNYVIGRDVLDVINNITLIRSSVVSSHNKIEYLP